MNRSNCALVVTILLAMPRLAALGQTGACCLSNGTCRLTDSADCASRGGDYLGDSSICVANLCKGGCCRPSGECSLNIARLNCEVNGGTYLGHSSDCTGVSCPVLPNGACCREAFCQEGFTEEACLGVWPGDGSTCNDCSGACCLSDDTCVDDVTRGECLEIEGASFPRNLSVCPIDGCGVGACCFASVEPGGNCSGPIDPFNCEASHGLYQGHGSDCTTVACPLFGGGCCCGGFSCFVTTQEECATIGCTFLGEQVACGDEGQCPGVGACCADGACSQADSFSCVEAGGAYRGEGTVCEPSLCAAKPVGACCEVIFGTSRCFNTDEQTCQNEGGQFRGAGTQCEDLDPPCNGACCTGGGVCRDGVTPEECSLSNERFLGMGSTCTTTSCGACCYDDGSCVHPIRFTECLDGGGSFRSPGVCEGDTDGDGVDDACKTGACCFESTGGPETTCENGHTRGTCGGTYAGDDTICLGDQDASGVDDACERCQRAEDCFDAVVCTVDICDPKSGECQYVPDDDVCRDETACTVNERCDATLGCLSTVLDCDDEVGCTIDTCDPVVGCLNGADHTRCDDHDACTTDLCRPLDPQRDINGCIHAPTDCSDGIECTNDSCDPVTGACANTPDDAQCEGDGCTVRGCDLHEGCVPVEYVCGACCTADPFLIIDCTDTTQTNCESGGNQFRGVGTRCANLDPPCMGACCVGGAGCAQTTRPDCEDRFGDWYGRGSSCEEIDCGACCAPGIGCINGSSSEHCTMPDPTQPEIAGAFFPQQSCDEVPCGACCDEAGECIDGIVATTCQTAGDEFRGSGSRCSGLIEGSCGDGAACLDDDHCRTSAPDACHRRERCVEGICVPGEPIRCDDGDDCTADSCDAGFGCRHAPIQDCCRSDADCDTDPCVEAICDPSGRCITISSNCGACCRVGQPCIDGQTAEQCSGAFDAFLGVGSACATASCGACCDTQTGACTDGITESECHTADRAFQGPASTCDLDPCEGACCLPDGACIVSTSADCPGVFRELATSCAELDPACAPFGGACCLDDVLCVQAAPEACADVHAGRYQGDTTQCDDINCATTGACCLDDGACVQSTESGCFDGTFQGAGTSCAEACQGACCRSDGSCTVGSARHCAGDFRGVGTNCDELDPTCAPFVGGACCLSPSGCMDGTTAASCGAFLGGRHQGDATRCAEIDCAGTGACCLSDGSCVQSTESGCLEGTFQGPGTECPEACILRGDINDDGSVDLLDWGAIVTFFGQSVGPGHPGERADLDKNGHVGLEDVALFVPFMAGSP